MNVKAAMDRDVFETKIKGILPTLKDWKDSAFPMVRGTLLGFFMGILPGIGAIIPTFITYGMEKKLSRHPEKFGTGVIEGVAAPEACNNAAASGNFIPMLSLGIPANPIMALFLGALLIYGVQPGPLLIKEQPGLFWGLIASMYVGNIMLLVLNLPLISLWVRVLKVPYVILYPLILLFCLIGAYSLNNSVGDVVIMCIFGVVGYLMKKFEYDAAPLVLALVLGPMLEENLRQTLIISRGNLLVFFSRPLSMIFISVSILVLLFPLFRLRPAAKYRQED
jgi:putative tricarboxylic transport membrane protein